MEIYQILSNLTDRILWMKNWGFGKESAEISFYWLAEIAAVQSESQLSILSRNCGQFSGERRSFSAGGLRKK